jgi:hypothetical protein
LGKCRDPAACPDALTSLHPIQRSNRARQKGQISGVFGWLIGVKRRRRDVLGKIFPNFKKNPSIWKKFSLLFPFAKPTS